MRNNVVPVVALVLGIACLYWAAPVILGGIGKGAAKISESYRSADSANNKKDTVYIIINKQ